MQKAQIQFVRDCESIWISDIHLGHKDCNAESLINFLKTVKPKKLFLLGDIVDFWEFKSGMRWPHSHTRLIKLFLKMAKNGCQIFYIPGNHDANLRKFIGYRYKNIRIYKEYIYTNKSGKKLLLLHGDKFDNLVRLNNIYGWIGDISYDILLVLNRWYNFFRKKFGYPYWSLSTYLKENIKQAKNALKTYANAAVQEAKKRECNGVICGHIHHPEIQVIDGITYYNDGDWIENNSALIEDENGKIELIRFRPQLSDSSKTEESYLQPDNHQPDNHPEPKRKSA